MGLITDMLHPIKEQRITMADIIGHPWIDGQTATLEEVQQYFAGRNQNNKK